MDGIPESNYRDMVGMVSCEIIMLLHGVRVHIMDLFPLGQSQIT